MCFGKVNDKIAVVDSINALNKMLHADGVNERLRSWRSLGFRTVCFERVVLR